jgi:hypothetical protein
MERVAGEERAFSRAITFGDALTLDRNVFGDEPNLKLDDWLKPEDKFYDRQRTTQWRSPPTPTDKDSSTKFGSGSPPTDLLDRQQLKHTERRVLSPIDSSLWDRAKWRGTLFITVEGGAAPPMLGIAFLNGDVGEAIFKAWRERWGEEDVNDALRVGIVTGISAQSPAHYAVTIGPNVNQLRNLRGKVFMTVSRINRMTPSTSSNLDRFVQAYREFGGYLLIPAQIGLNPRLPPELYLAKRQLHLRAAWEIGENDPDLMALHDDDDPIIPAGVQDVPVKRAMERLRSLKK